MANRGFCLDCLNNTFKTREYYMLRNEIWALTNVGRKGMLCIECCEARIGRQLIPSDFSDCYLNTSKSFERSMRLNNRMGIL